MTAVKYRGRRWRIEGCGLTWRSSRGNCLNRCSNERQEWISKTLQDMDLLRLARIKIMKFEVRPDAKDSIVDGLVSAYIGIKQGNIILSSSTLNPGSQLGPKWLAITDSLTALHCYLYLSIYGELPLEAWLMSEASQCNHNKPDWSSGIAASNSRVQAECTAIS